MQIKNLTTLFLIITLTSQIKIEQSKITLFQEPQGDYDQCYEILVKIGIHLVSLVKDATASNIPSIIYEVYEVIKDVYTDIKCFTKNGVLELFKSFYGKMYSVKDSRKECFLSHLNSAFEHLKSGADSLVHFDFNGFKNEFGSAVDVLQEAVDQC